MPDTMHPEPGSGSIGLFAVTMIPDKLLGMNHVSCCTVLVSRIFDMTRRRGFSLQQDVTRDYLQT